MVYKPTAVKVLQKSVKVKLKLKTRLNYCLFLGYEASPDTSVQVPY